MKKFRLHIVFLFGEEITKDFKSYDLADSYAEWYRDSYKATDNAIVYTQICEL